MPKYLAVLCGATGRVVRASRTTVHVVAKSKVARPDAVLAGAGLHAPELLDGMTPRLHDSLRTTLSMPDTKPSDRRASSRNRKSQPIRRAPGPAGPLDY